MKRLILFLAAVALTCSPAFGAYTWYSSPFNYYSSGCYSIYDNSSSGVTVGAVKMTMNLPSGVLDGYYNQYIGMNVPGQTGPYVYTNIQPWNSTSAYFTIVYFNGTQHTSLGYVVAAASNGMVVMTTAGTNFISVYVNNVMVLSVARPAGWFSGGSGGVSGCTGASGDYISSHSVGPVDSGAPNAVPSGSIGISSFTNHIDLQWPVASDNTNGIGIMQYQILRNGQVVGSTTGLTYSDTTVNPSTGYSYTLKVNDYFLNSASTNFTAMSQGLPTNPPYPSAIPEGRRVGVRTTGAYWGAAGENIDVRSGNLSYSLPLLSAHGRTGWKVGFNLAYNSQNWRYDSGGNWKFEGNVGYGFGWNLLAGSITPVWNPGGMSAAYFLFMDSTGAEYRLDQNSGNVWSSKDSVYVYYNANTSTLYFRDGTSWYFGCVSAATEADAGVMYPTLMQDTNGNKITVTYKQASGASWTNSSARIDKIRDVRKADTDPVGSYSYLFTYNTSTPPQLISISNNIGTNESFSFTYLNGQALVSPFNGQSFGTTAFLNSATVVNSSFIYNFIHNGSGELTRVTMPQGGYFAYDYTTMTYSSGRQYREVIRRYLSKDGSAQTTYPFSHEASPGPDVHSFTILDDPGGVGEKYWAFSTSGFTMGLATQYQGRQLPGPVTKTQSDFTWAQDAVGNSYISSTLSTSDPGQSYQVQKKTNQTVDIYGNVTQVQNFHYGNLTTPARTYNYTYLNTSGYTSKYIYNRLTVASVTDGTSDVTLATNGYDGCGLCPAYAGNLTNSTTLGGVQTLAYDTKGNVTATTVNGVTETLTYNSSTNFAAPSQVTVGSLTENMTYNSFLGLTNETDPNGASTAISYTDIRPSSTTSKFGAVTNYQYTFDTTKAIINPSQGVNARFTKTYTDGLGRTVKVEAGTGNTTPIVVSQADTEFDSCGCSPVGKLKRKSQPHAPSLAYGSYKWTTYNYDGIGRTLSVQLPDNAGTTTYAYQGNVVTVTDPAGKWKKYTSDALGRLTQVEEPNPSGGSYFTTYTYDLLDHLTQVSMPRPTGTQTRTFNYNNTAFLQSATNPENGTVTYTYDSRKRRDTITDAKNQRTKFIYNDTYNRVTQIQRGTMSGSTFTEDINQRTTFTYDQGAYGLGRLTGVAYTGGRCTTINPFSGCDSIAETYTYSQPGAMLSKAVALTRNSVTGTLTTSQTYDNEGRVTAGTYPAWTGCSSCAQVNGSQYSYTYDSMGRLNTMVDVRNNNKTLISGVTYGVANEMQQLTSVDAGVASETRTYNSLFQMTRLKLKSYNPPLGDPTVLDVQYNYPATQNSGKIGSQTDVLSGETVTYTYDALNRLATAVGSGWGQSYTYDGFGNLTDQNVISGSAPTMHVVYNAATNRQTTDSADANGNIGAGNIYDIQNRLLQGSGTTMRYAYDAGNKRIWRGDGALVDELTIWGIGGQRLGAYKVSVTGNAMYFALQTTEVYFGGKRVSEGTHTGGYTGCGDCVALTSVVQDRLGSIGKYYPYGQERPSATANDKEKFTGYFRDSATGLDYADQRYHQPGVGRFMSPDPYKASASATDPGSGNRYAYVGGDPVNRTDPTGQFWVDQWDNICTGCLNLGFDPWGWGYSDAENCWVTDPVCNGVATDYVPTVTRGARLGADRIARDALAVATLAYNIIRTSSQVKLPTYLAKTSECWSPTGDDVGVASATYTLSVTYQILDQYGKPMKGSELGGVSISESFSHQTGNLELTPSTWTTARGIESTGQLTDFLTAGGGVVGDREGGAFQSFDAWGTVGGVPFIQQLSIVGHGPTTSILDNSYSKDGVFINGMGLGTNAASRCR